MDYHLHYQFNAFYPFHDLNNYHFQIVMNIKDYLEIQNLWDRLLYLTLYFYSPHRNSMKIHHIIQSIPIFIFYFLGERNSF